MNRRVTDQVIAPPPSMLELLTRCADRLNVDRLDDRERSYLWSYPVLVSYFESLATIEDHHTTIAASFTFAWLPTIARLNQAALAEATAILNRAKKGELPTLDQVCGIQHFTGNSTVAASKLLHFVAPERYAIFDSKVLSFLLDAELPFTRTPNHPRSYLRYLALLEQLRSAPATAALQAMLIAKLGYPITRYRALEFCMFASGSASLGE